MSRSHWRKYKPASGDELYYFSPFASVLNSNLTSIYVSAEAFDGMNDQEVNDLTEKALKAEIDFGSRYFYEGDLTPDRTKIEKINFKI